MKLAIRRACLVLAMAMPNVGCFSVLTDLQLTPDAPITGSDRNDVASLPDEKSAEVCVAVGADLERAGHVADAITEYEQARKLEPKKYKHLSRRLAVLYDRVGEERKAVDEFEATLKRNPKDADLLNDFGYCHYNRGRWHEAETYFRKALAINPKHSRACTNLGLALAQQSKYDEALKAFQIVLRPAEAKANVAFVLAAQGKREEAKASYQQALSIDPTLATAQNGLAALEKGPPKKDGTQPVGAQVKAPAKKPAVTGPRTPESEPDQSPFLVDPKIMGKSK